MILILVLCGFMDANGSNVTGNKPGKEIKSPGMINLYANWRPGGPTWFEPLPAEVVGDLYDYTWLLIYKEYDDSQPRCCTVLNLSLRGGSYGDDYKFAGYSDNWCNRDICYQYDFPSLQEFEDIIAYLDENSEILFDYSAFEGTEPGRYPYPGEEVSEYFLLLATNPELIGPGITYAMVVTLPEDPPVSDEVTWVFDRLRELRDEVLLHPLE